jgi:hypothetical protein
MLSPNEYPRRILVAVTGLSPQIVTETLYGLMPRGKASCCGSGGTRVPSPSRWMVYAASRSSARTVNRQATARAEAEAWTVHQAELAAMSPNLRRIEEFKATFAARAEQLRGSRERLNADYHGRARKLAMDALDGADWTADEKRAVADAIAEWLPKVVEKIDKDQLKKLKRSSLHAP